MIVIPSMSKRVLIVNNEPNLLLSLEFLVAQSGHQVQVARTGEEALDSIPIFRPHLILLDVLLPFRNGFEICQIVRHRKEWQPVVIVMLSSKASDLDRAKGLALGADVFVSKPFSTHDLLRKIDELLGNLP